TGPISDGQPLRESDPIEGINRALFSFNDLLDRGFLEPIATGYSYVTPRVLRTSLDKAFTNLRFPVRFAGNLFQAEFKHTGEETLRFAVNSTVGIAGLFDPATRFGIGFYDEDFGQALGSYGIGPGPYLMLPIMGPSDTRDTLAMVVDAPL